MRKNVKVLNGDYRQTGKGSMMDTQECGKSQICVPRFLAERFIKFKDVETRKQLEALFIKALGE